MLNDERVWNEGIIRIQHGLTDDEFHTTESVTLMQAIEIAKTRTIETWDMYAQEDAGMNGFPVYGIAIELYDSNASMGTITCESQQLYFDDSGVMCGEWKVDTGLMLYDLTAQENKHDTVNI